MLPDLTRSVVFLFGPVLVPVSVPSPASTPPVYPDQIHAAASPIPAGATVPIVPVALDGWGAVYPDAVAARAVQPLSDRIAPVFPPAPAVVTGWGAVYPDVLPRVPYTVAASAPGAPASAEPAGAPAPLTVVVFPTSPIATYPSVFGVPFVEAAPVVETWWPTYPAWLPAPIVQPGATLLDPFPRPAVAVDLWGPVYPDAVVHQPVIPSSGIVDPFPRLTVTLGWGAVYPDAVPGRPVVPSSAVIDPFPRPPFELAWLPVYPDYVWAHRWQETRFTVVDPFPRPNEVFAWAVVYPSAFPPPDRTAATPAVFFTPPVPHFPVVPGWGAVYPDAIPVDRRQLAPSVTDQFGATITPAGVLFRRTLQQRIGGRTPPVKL